MFPNRLQESRLNRFICISIKISSGNSHFRPIAPVYSYLGGGFVLSDDIHGLCMLASRSPARVSRPFTSVANHTLWLEIEKDRENRACTHTHNTSTSVGRSSAGEMVKLNSLTFLSCSGKLYIQLYPSNPNTQTWQVAMLLQ